MNQGTLTSRTGQAQFQSPSEIIAGEWVEAHFQPIVSLRSFGGSWAQEGLNPGVSQEPRSDFPHGAFPPGRHPGMELELDRLCRKRIMDDFRLLHAHEPELILTLNLDASALTQGRGGLGIPAEPGAVRDGFEAREHRH